MLKHATRLTIPAMMLSPADLSRLHRELTTLDDYLRQQAVRTPGTASEELPKVSRLLEELASSNHLSLLSAGERQRLNSFLSDTASTAPVVHLSFAVEPSLAVLQKIVQWLRQNVRPDVLVRVGLQPSLAAGCTLRTTNKFFDFSLQQYLKRQRPLLVNALTVAEPSSAPATPSPEAPA